MLRVTDIEIPALDGLSLAASLFEPRERVAAATVLVTSATAVRRRYYNAFATDLAERGFRVVTFDYRGVGGSRPRSLRSAGGRMRDWAERDTDGVLAWIGERYPRSRLLLVAHSFGGQAIGLLRRRERVRAALMVASCNGYWRRWPVAAWPRMLALWYVVVPVATRLLGYFPGRMLGLGEDLPSSIARDWARWCRQPGYLLDDDPAALRDRYAAVDLPIRCYSFTDDPYSPRPAVEALLAWYTGTDVDHRRLRPEDVGARSIGHFGFFRDRFRDTLWPEAAGWLAERAEDGASRARQGS